MRLKNKKTGEIATLTLSSNGEELLLMKNNAMVTRDVKLSDLEDWEDYKRRPWWYIGIDLVVKQGELFLSRHAEEFKEVGNYFSSREEAEKAVEKLKAWKRLKDSHFIRFDLDFVKNTISFTYRIDGTLHSSVNEERIVFEDMKTIFGGE